MKFRNYVCNHSVILLVIVIFTTATMSCSNPEKDFEKARATNTIEVYEEFIKKHPESELIEEANKIIQDLAFNEAKAKNTIEAYEGFTNKYPESIHTDEAKKMILEVAYGNALKANTVKAFNDFIKTYNPDKEYVSKINEKIKQKQEYLQSAIDAHILAQQETDSKKTRQLFNKSEELFNKANFEEAMLDISTFPLLNLHLGGESSLVKTINRPFRTSRFLYGGSGTDRYEYSVKNEQLNTYTLYNLFLASANKTSFLMKVCVKRGKKEIEICRNRFSVNSDYYTGYSGLIKNKNLALRKGDKIVLIITGSGSNFGTSCEDFASYIKVLKPARTIPDNVLSEKEKALSWIISQIKHNIPSSLLLSFIAQIDHCVLENKNGEWLFGQGNTKTAEPYKVKWDNNIFVVEKLTMEQAKSLGIKESAISFSID